MDKLVRKHLRQPLKKGVKREYYWEEYLIYTEKEAKDHKIPYKAWRDCNMGDFGLSDDGYVAVCIKRREYEKYTNYVFPYGQVFGGPKKKLLYEPHRKTGSYASITAQTFEDKYRRNRQYKNFAKAYAIQFVSGNLDYDKLGKIFSPTDGNPSAKTKSLLKKEYVKEMIDDELKKILAEKEIDEGSVLDMIKKAHEVANDKLDPANMMRAAEVLVKILGLYDRKQPDIHQIEGEFMSLAEIEDTLAIDGEKIENGKNV